MHTDRHAQGRAEQGSLCGQRLRVLVADDATYNADVWALLLTQDGHAVFVAYDGLSALRVAEAERPDVVLSDISMPGLDGYGLAARLRGMVRYAPLLIAVTARCSDEDRRRGEEAGFDHYFVKPADPAAVQDLLAGFSRCRLQRPSPDGVALPPQGHRPRT
jgi:CheY-like chemotaxis protein